MNRTTDLCFTKTFPDFGFHFPSRKIMNRPSPGHQQAAVNALPKCLNDFSFPNCPKLAGTFSAMRSAANLG
jgi:hypothetical protein